MSSCVHSFMRFLVAVLAATVTGFFALTAPVMAQTATYYTNTSQSAGNWATASGGAAGTIWNTSPTGAGGTSETFTANNSADWVAVSGALVRSTSMSSFTGYALILDAGAQIRFKGTTASGGYGAASPTYQTASVYFNASPSGTAAGTGLILNGGTLDPGDNGPATPVASGSMYTLTGLLNVASNSFVDCGNGANTTGRVIDLEMSISGSNMITLVNAGASTNTYSGSNGALFGSRKQRRDRLEHVFRHLEH